MKKILLFIGMFLFIFNVKALTFNVDVTNIEDKGNNGTIGSITNIDVTNKTLDALFQNVGDEVSFDITISNSGNRAGTLRSIGVTSTNNKIKYTHSLPEGGLAINGNDTNTVTITAKVLQGATNGTSSSTIKITYNYDEGSCPEGEILSDDESMCLCPEGQERNEFGICVTPEVPVTCEDDEIYNETKKICEKKVEPVIPDDPTPDDPTPNPEPTPTPVNPSNPKTMDNIILITLLFVVSGLGIYAVMFKKLNTNTKKVTAGVITGVITLSLSFTVLASVFGLDNLLGAIVNPITKKQELVVTVNETIDMIETWDGRCELSAYEDLYPEYIFEGGSGTESDPYTIKTAEQLGCFAKSVNNGETYEGQFIKQIRNIKLNDNLIESADADDWTGIHYWTSIGNYAWDYYFGGTYDGDNHTISGVYLENFSMNSDSPKGLFGYTYYATIKNLTLSDVYINVTQYSASSLIGIAKGKLTVDNITTYGKFADPGRAGGGIIDKFDGIDNSDGLLIENCTNNVSPVSGGVIRTVENVNFSQEPNVVFRNVTNNGTFTKSGGIVDTVLGTYTSNGPGANVLFDNAVNTGNYQVVWQDTTIGGIIGAASVDKLEIKNSHNTGNFSQYSGIHEVGGLGGNLSAQNGLVIDNCYNSGNLTTTYLDSYADGVTVEEANDLRRMNCTFDMGGLVGKTYSYRGTVLIKDSYNTGTLAGLNYDTGGLVGNNNGPNSVGDNITIQDSHNSGDIYTGYRTTGGLIGLSKGTIRNSYNEGTITVWGFVDAFSELSDGSLHYGDPVGGLVGKGNNLTITSATDTAGATIIDSYNTGDIIITAKTNEVNIGGLCGHCGDISGSHNSGNIISSYATQYFDGIGFRTGTVTDSYNDGTITPGVGY